MTPKCTKIMIYVKTIFKGVLGSQSTSGVKLLTHQYLIDCICSFDLPNIDENFIFFKEELLSGQTYNEDQIVGLKRRFAHFKSEINKDGLKLIKWKMLFERTMICGFKGHLNFQ